MSVSAASVSSRDWPWRCESGPPPHERRPGRRRRTRRASISGSDNPGTASEDETKLVDATGDYSQVVRGGEPVADPRWRSARVVLTNRPPAGRLGGQPVVPHDRIEPTAVPEHAPHGVGDGATALRVGEHVFLVDASTENFDREYCRAALDAAAVLVKHPAVVGVVGVVGVVVQDTEWSKARLKISDVDIRFALADGDLVVVDRDDVGEVEIAERTAPGEESPSSRSNTLTRRASSATAPTWTRGRWKCGS